MKTSGVSSRGEFKTSGGFEIVEVTATGGGFEFVGVTATGGGVEFVEVDGGMSPLHAARNDAARTNEDIFRKSRREEFFFI
jgi:hypothetical protein